MLPIYETPRRILAWVHERTLCYPASSTFCVDDRGNALQQKDCLRSLNEAARQFAEKDGTELVVLDKSAISRGFAHLKKFGLVRFDDEQGRIYLCGKVTPTPEAYSSSDEDSISPDLRELLKQFPADERKVIVQGLLERQARLKKAIADAVRPVRQLHRQADLDFLAEHGIGKPAGRKKYARLHVRATPPTKNHQVTEEELRVHATDGPKLPSGGSAAAAPAKGDELRVHATPETAAEESSPQLVPTFKEWQELYPVRRLDAQKADQIFNTLSTADRIKATEGLRAHLGCERWRLTPDYIPLASNFLKRREYDYPPPCYFELKDGKGNGNSMARNSVANRTHDPASPLTAEQLGSYLLSNARAVGTAGFRKIAEELENLAADPERHLSDLEALEALLCGMENKIVDELKSAWTTEQLVEYQRGLTAELKPYRDKMAGEQLDMMIRNYLERYALNEANLPRLSLFYMR